MFRRNFAVCLAGLLLGLGLFLSPAGVFADQPNDAKSWVGTWTGTISTLDSNNGKPVVSPFSVTITQAEIGKGWTVLGDSIAKSESVAGVRSSTTLKRTGADTCTLVADGIGSGRSGFTRHVTGELTRH